MATTQRIADYYQWVIENGDPKTADWPLVATPWPTIALVATYLFIVKVGPKIMEKREAYNFKEVLILYNFALVILSAWMMYEFIASTLDIPNFNFFCEPVPYVRGDKRQNRLARVCYVYWLSKFVEYFDTFFFILRKKNNQVTFLHVYHHASMCILWWIVCKYIPGGVSYFGAACNCFVHVMMYAYYGLSAIGPHMRPYLWWKRYITKLQLTQFVLVVIYLLNVYRSNCVGFWENVLLTLYLIYLASLLILFGNFYIQSYLKKNQASRSSKQSKSE
ncbi:PREDICTED: elongation of very long chain fatty acids protein 5-like isoform X1 [Acropora digitifera]|uniref:elongation of very long chain fatty acids protein 5-like isoform X1 n=1 Tax=Acropora digitifera TaxID=70779 RepID=UPI00077A1227|nr:PREDICTED: elongation of very long chain fatty acids protein 5-like isoform X1 [Acropora digitifera]XP_015762301.1 PREDICTED: elongation of very long chain fatty acids protein 5-like isoform X1 [Acropora digitifera]XP_015762302.1 PREDICTED: elongation of very long chain fatty acids protein 5-like isoform X1 [Acropora digitifera]XP_015762303.1 PREDICTED: elongation of very long chain fatty acids protein 5-like isoform X1 [Acropora digitifera]XP_015762304.1 PREDICTED: elongation of very long c